MNAHPSITLDRVMSAAEDSMFDLYNTGFCISCGEEHEGIEPDAEGVECEHCGESKVYGAEQLLLLNVG